MGKDTVPEYLDLIKQHLAFQEQLIQALFKAETLIELVLDQDLATYSLSKLHNCLLIISDLILKAIALSESLMPAANKITPMFLPKDPPD
jgi:hypothetical protein